MNIVMNKQALIEHLTSRLKAAKAEDARIAKKHKEDEQVALMKFRAKLREALKWDYAKAKGQRYNYMHLESPACPVPNANMIDRELKCVQLDMRKAEQYTIQPKTELYEAVNWLPESERPKKSICED